MRAIVDFIVMMLVFAVLRAVVSAVVKGFSGTPSPAAGPSGQPTRKQPPKTDLNQGGELRRDPVCGTYVAMGSSLHRSQGGTTEYFCSQKCLDRYKAA